MEDRSGTHVQFMLILPLYLLVMVAGMSSTVMATDLPIRGGNGGIEFTDTCPAGFYLVGFDGRNGAWIDQLATICAPWLANQRTFGQVVTGSPHGTSQGGIFNRRICPTNRAISGLYIFPTIKDNRHEPQFLGTVGVSCDNVAPPFLKLSTQMKGGFSFGCVGRPECGKGIVRETWTDHCPEGEIAVGIRGRAGLFLDALGLVCGPRPPLPGAPAMKLPDSLIQSPYPTAPMNPQAKNMRIPDDVFVITRPNAVDPVPHGQLIITAASGREYTPDPNEVAEVELIFLDAPPTQRDSYPYYQTFSVGIAQLRQGYPVTEFVTGGYVGSWQVRARYGMKTPPGPWSPPVQFKMVKAQPASPPPPMVHQAPQPSAPIMQPTPPPPSSQTKRSPLMIRPRGVNEEDAGSGPAEQKEPAKTR